MRSRACVRSLSGESGLVGEMPGERSLEEIHQNGGRCLGSFGESCGFGGWVDARHASNVRFGAVLVLVRAAPASCQQWFSAAADGGLVFVLTARSHEVPEMSKLSAAPLPRPSRAHATCAWCRAEFPTIVDLIDHVDHGHAQLPAGNGAPRPRTGTAARP